MAGLHMHPLSFPLPLYRTKKVIEERNPAFSCSLEVGPFGKKPGFSPVPDFFVLYTVPL